MLELQITQEYLGQGTHLAYLAPLFKEALDADTCALGPGWPVARLADGSFGADSMGYLFGGIAAVANIGDDRNWCGHPFAQANWYAFGRLAWDDSLPADEIADEWLRMTFTPDDRFVTPVKKMMLSSREAVVDYMTPLGLHHRSRRYAGGSPSDRSAPARPGWLGRHVVGTVARRETTGAGRDRQGGEREGPHARPPRVKKLNH